ncbi:hypothetical protein SETIT_5G207100v2 [Setaria italica]|uniref:C3H1-type domain-containing protein n=1 Tax=Setaria italica TaxID=4555 RepID=K3XF83_SETIT|nr:zinc finger CCCH domain-containing protein 7 [Setaria italica]XP_022682856.1 zinc finger CCCH domain-containing protein 7 [Setaria italica]XP_022682857.1 zinc finger CCCH domain-containing protein 7 [Setaria italica]XP_022682858.1 zinc finger CCCH domain-containing protein 7 [Setaria italica]RCV25964.1 hypothetical protein SETIT_5G207100v2 [Setaria italica]RCV25965.1 hypothetical protein SETIT_5G207100v2 [Setaria italica]
MEDALATSPLAPPPAPLAAAAVLTRRRSHLDSASYRTLSRLFSHCLHLHPSPREGTALPEAEPAAANPTGGDSGDSLQVPRGADFDPLKNVEKEAADAGGPPLYGTVSPAREQPAAANPTGNPCEAGAPQRSHDDANEVVAVESTCVNTGAGVDESGIGAELVDVGDDALKSVKACLEMTEVDESVEGALGNEDGQLLLDAMMTNFTGLIDDVGAGVVPAQPCVVSGGELQNSKASEDLNQSVGRIEDGEPVTNLDHELNGDGGFEEGEIEGEFQALDSEESGDSELGDNDDSEEKLGGDSVSRGSGANKSSDHGTQFGNLHSTPEIIGNGHLTLNNDGVRGGAQISVTRAPAVSYDEIVDWNGTPLPDNMAPNPGKKRKRSMTEERKAKKTENKRKKRAQQRIADGVNRPKIQHVMKPKKPCHFYDHGKCQQGNKCKFSHDFTPSTKSKPCKHFACGSCLKGDDCPYDHELSKYECHNYKNNGMCIRGDRCKFSHVMQTTEGTPTQDAKPSDASLAYEKTNLREQTSSQKTSTVHNGEPVTSAPTKQQCSILKNLAGFSINSQNVSNRIPKGVQFLPIDKSGSNLSSLRLGALSIEKPRNANATQHQYLREHEAERQKIAKQNGQESLLDEKNSSNEATVHPFSDPKKATLPISSTATSVHTQPEVSEASRILQEFLFGAGS